MKLGVLHQNDDENMEHFDENMKGDVTERQNIEHNVIESQNIKHVTEHQNYDETIDFDVTENQNIKHNVTEHQNNDENLKDDGTKHQSEENMKNIDVSITLNNKDENTKNNVTRYETTDDMFKGSDVKQNETKEETQAKNTDVNCNLFDKVNTETDAKKSPSRKRKHKRSLKRIEKSKHSTKNHSNDKQKIRSQSESLTDINILKRLLNEKDLCSQLLLELTTGKAADKIITTLSNSDNQIINASCSETQNKFDTQSNIQDPKLTNESKLCETPKNGKSKRSEKTQKQKETSKYSTRTLKSLDPKRLSKTLIDSETDPEELKNIKDSFESTKYLKTLKEKETNEVLKTDPTSKTTKHSDKTPKSSQKRFEETQRGLNRSSSPKHSNKTKHKTIKDSTKSPKLSNNIPKSKSPKDFNPSTNSKINLDKNRDSVIDIPKHKTIEMLHDSSLEISENDQHINIDVIKVEDSPTTENSYKTLNVKLPDQLKTCFKFSPIEDSIDKNEIGIDLESFKKEYLSEVDRDFKCSFKHKHVDKKSAERRFRSPIDFAIDATIKKETVNTGNNNKKRKLSENRVKLVFDHSVVKRRKTSESDLELVCNYDKITEYSEDIDKTSAENNEGKKKSNKHKLTKRETKKRRRAKRNKRKSSSDKNIEVTIDSSEKRRNKDKKIKKKIKTKFAIKNDNIQFKIKWKKKEFSLNIESKDQDKNKTEKKDKDSKFKQYVLQIPEGSSKNVLVKPEKEVCPLKRKYFRNEKSPDKLKQMSISNFFKVKSEQ